MELSNTEEGEKIPKPRNLNFTRQFLVFPLASYLSQGDMKCEINSQARNTMANRPQYPHQ